MVSSLTFYANDQRASGSKLIFSKYGDQYFLHQVLSPAAAINVGIPTSKLETKARRRLFSQIDVETIQVAAE